MLCGSSRHHVDVQQRLHEPLLQLELGGFKSLRVINNPLLPLEEDGIGDIVGKVDSVMH